MASPNNGMPDIQTAVSRYLSRASVEQPGTVPLLATYRILHGLCGHASDPTADAAFYHNFIEGFAQGIGSYRAVLFLEMDSIITMPCLSQHGKAVREHDLQDAINILTANPPHLVIYLDAGAADALSARPPTRESPAGDASRVRRRPASTGRRTRRCSCATPTSACISSSERAASLRRTCTVPVRPRGIPVAG
jgi:Glycosyl hydrolases family 6